MYFFLSTNSTIMPNIKRADKNIRFYTGTRLIHRNLKVHSTHNYTYISITVFKSSSTSMIYIQGCQDENWYYLK